MSRFEFSVGIDVVMMVMCIMLVVSAAVNESIYDTASAFKMTGDTVDTDTGAGAGARARKARKARKARTDTAEHAKLRRSALVIGLNVDEANVLSNVVTILGSVALGMYALSLAQKKGKGGTGGSSNKAPGIVTAVVGFSVAIALIISGVAAGGIFNEIETFKEGKIDSAKTARDVSYGFIALGVVIPALYAGKFVWDKKSTFGGIRPFAPRLTGGGGLNNAASVFFTY